MLTPLRVPAVLVAALALSLTACGSASSGGGGAGSSSSGAGSATGHPTPAAVVLLKYVSFVPARVTIHVGQTVEWKWEDSPVSHNVTFSGFGTPTQASGTFFHTFDTPGTYHYRCSIHAQMTGVVVVLP